MNYIYLYLAIGSMINVPAFYLLYKKKLGKEGEELLERFQMLPPVYQMSVQLMMVMLWPAQILRLIGLL